MDSALVPRLRGQPGSAAAVRFGIQLRRLSSQAGVASQHKALVVDDLEGEAGQDWREGRDPRVARHVSDG